MMLRRASRMLALSSADTLTITTPDEELEITGDDALHIAQALESVGEGPIDAMRIDDDVRELLMDLGAFVETRVNDGEHAFSPGTLFIRSLYDDESFTRAFARGSDVAIVVQLSGAIIVPLKEVCVWCVRERMLARRSVSVWERAVAVKAKTTRLVCGPSLVGRTALVAGLVAACASSSGTPVVVDENGAAESHPLLPHPLCPACRGAPIVERALAERALLSIFADIAASTNDATPHALFDPVFGPLTKSSVSTRGVGFRGLPIVQGGIAYIGSSGHRSSTQTAAMGSGPDIVTREAVLLSELVERYALRTRHVDVAAKTARELAEAAISPSAFASFRTDDRARFELPFKEAHDDAVLDWVWALDLAARAPRLVPYDHVVLDQSGDLAHRLVELHVSTGAASHPRPWSAVFSGLREVLERDAAMIAWYKRVPLPQITLPRVLANDVAEELREHLTRRGLRFTVFDLRLDIPMPGVFVVATRDESEGSFERGAMVAASAMGRDVESALAHALQELAFHDETLSLFPDPSKDWRHVTYDPESKEEGRGSWWPLYTYYLNPAHQEAFSFLLSSTNTVSLEEIAPLEGTDDEARVRTLTALIGEVHPHAPLVVDLATPDMRVAGRTTVKMLIPGFIDAASGRQTMRLMSPRIESAARARGHGCLQNDVFNPDPHPAM